MSVLKKKMLNSNNPVPLLYNERGLLLIFFNAALYVLYVSYNLHYTLFYSILYYFQHRQEVQYFKHFNI